MACALLSLPSQLFLIVEILLDSMTYTDRDMLTR